MIALLACNESKHKNDEAKNITTQTETKTTERGPVANTLNIKIPESPDAELNEFFKAYTAHINRYVAAVKANNKEDIKTEFDNDTKFLAQSMSLPARLKEEAPSEWEKYHYFKIEMGQYKSEIDESPYVQQLRKEL